MFPDERALRDRISQLTGRYDQASRTLTTVIARMSDSGEATATIADLAPALDEINSAEQILKQVVSSWNNCSLGMKRTLAEEMARLKLSAAECVDTVFAAEREFGKRRDGVSLRIDETANRNRAVRAYSNAMRR